VKAPDVTVVVCTYNRAESLRLALADVVSQVTNDFSHEVLVVDDGSTDHTTNVIEEARRLSPVVLRRVESGGTSVAAARNRGIREAAGEWVVFFDDDQRADPQWLEQLCTAGWASGGQFAGGPIVLDLPNGREVGPTVRAILGEYPPAKDAKSPLPPGGNRLISREVFSRIGLHDESITTGGEDYDLLLRAVDAGVRFTWVSSAVVHHVIPVDRLDVETLRSYCLLSGVGRARADRRYLGSTRQMYRLFVRIAKGWIANAGAWIWAIAAGSSSTEADCRARFWLTKGYVQETVKQHQDAEDKSQSFRDLR